MGGGRDSFAEVISITPPSSATLGPSADWVDDYDASESGAVIGERVLSVRGSAGRTSASVSVGRWPSRRGRGGQRALAAREGLGPDLQC